MKIHLDLDCYFVSAERVRNPLLNNKNVVVAKGSDKRIFSQEKKQGTILGDTGAFNSVLEFSNNYSRNINQAWRDEFVDTDGKIKGVVIAKSYEAKKYGIKTGTFLSDALKMCPDLIIIPSDHLYYQELSQKLKRYLEYKIPILEQYSIDEFFGDLSGWVDEDDTLDFITQLRNEIMQLFGLPITIGASKSKWIAKLLTDQAKPFGVLVVPQDEVPAITDNIDVNEFPGVGRAISKKLAYYKVSTLQELRNRPELLYSYGKFGRDLYRRVCGIDNERVIPYHDRRGIGIGRNFKAIENRNEIQRRIIILARYLSYTINKLKLNPTTFYFKIKYEYGVKNSVSTTIDRLFNENFFIKLAQDVINGLDIHPKHKIQYISMNASNFIGSPKYKTYNMLTYSSDIKYAALNLQLNKIRDKYGVDSIKYGRELIHYKELVL